MIHRSHPLPPPARPDDKLSTRLGYLAVLLVGVTLAMVVTALVMRGFA